MSFRQWWVVGGDSNHLYLSLLVNKQLMSLSVVGS